MSLTLVITRDVQPRYRGFLGSVMLELAPGVYVSPRMSGRVRERVLDVIADWHATLGQGSIVMVWRAKSKLGGIEMRLFGEAPKEIIEADGLLITRRPISAKS